MKMTRSRCSTRAGLPADPKDAVDPPDVLDGGGEGSLFRRGERSKRSTSKESLVSCQRLEKGPYHHAVCGRHVMLRRFRPEAACEFIQRERVNYFEIVPTMADILVHFADLGRYDLTSLKRIVLGGASLTTATHNALMEKFPGCLVYCGYGLRRNGLLRNYGGP